MNVPRFPRRISTNCRAEDDGTAPLLDTPPARRNAARDRHAAPKHLQSQHFEMLGNAATPRAELARRPGRAVRRGIPGLRERPGETSRTPIESHHPCVLDGPATPGLASPTGRRPNRHPCDERLCVMAVEFISLTYPNASNELSPIPGAQIDKDYLVRYARAVEDAGFDYTLQPYGSHSFDPFITATTLAQYTERVKPIVALRPNNIHPTYAAKTLATLDQVSGDGRSCTSSPAETTPSRRARATSSRRSSATRAPRSTSASCAGRGSRTSRSTGTASTTGSSGTRTGCGP